ncbi:protein-export chaperone SecB [Pseudomonadota bacterium]|nr:protein-export chaperone SecB [Pseudomonadota bacterium]
MTKVNEFLRPQLNILNQYIKDLSYENPQSINQIKSDNITSNVSLDMNVFYQSFDNDCFGITLKIICYSIFENNTLFHLELDYGGFFKILNNINFREDILTNEAARLLFPFARSIIANLTQNGGSLPIFLDNVDFNLIKKTN